MIGITACEVQLSSKYGDGSSKADAILAINHIDPFTHAEAVHGVNQTGL